VLGAGGSLGVVQIQLGLVGTQHDHRTIVLLITFHSSLKFVLDHPYLYLLQLSVTTLSLVT
jgi:hypothetical protein